MSSVVEPTTAKQAPIAAKITHRVCTRCVMDTTDPDITFDANGECIHCRRYDETVRRRVFSGAEGRRRLDEIAARIKQEGAGRKYDCIIGVSGGVDSTYVAYVVKQLGLRPLAVHLDNGWDSELAVKNIENVLKTLDIDLYTYVLDWNEFRDLQLSFLKASTPDSEIPSDHAIVAIMRIMAEKYGIRYVISGQNVRTESHLPPAWSQGHQDWKYIRSVHARFGRVKLRTFPRTGFLAWHRSYFSQTRLDVLDFVDYVKADAMKVLERDLGWRYYGGKHYESIYTRFYQGYILPKKFGYDKRKTHLSSLICSGQITRDEALRELKTEIYPADIQKQDREYVVKKLGLTDTQFEEIMRLPRKSFWDYPSYARMYASAPYRMLLGAYRALRGPSRAGTGL